MWRQPGARLELPGEVIGAEMSDGSHLLQRGTAFEIFHDVLDDRAELPVWKYAACRGRRPDGQCKYVRSRCARRGDFPAGRRMVTNRLHFRPFHPVAGRQRVKRKSCSSERYKHEANRLSRSGVSVSQPQMVRVPITRELCYSEVEFAGSEI